MTDEKLKSNVTLNFIIKYDQNKILLHEMFWPRKTKHHDFYWWEAYSFGNVSPEVFIQNVSGNFLL